MTDKKEWARSELASSAYLFRRLEEDMLAVHRQMEVLRIIFKNLEGSWLAISLIHKAFRIHTEDKP